MQGLPHGAILQQRVPTSALESRRAQTRMQAIEKKERKKQKLNIHTERKNSKFKIITVPQTGLGVG
jgi:hypothetical protein